MLPSSVTRVKKSKATGDTLTFTAASVHTSFNNNIELRLGHVLKSFFACFPVCYSANWLFPKSMLFSIIAGLALAEPGGPWCLTYALGRLENCWIFHTNLGTLDFTISEHWASFNFP